MVLVIILMMLIIMIQIKGNGVLGAHAGSRQFIKKPEEQLLQQWKGNLLQLKRDLFGIIKGGFSDGGSSIKGTNCVKL